MYMTLASQLTTGTKICKVEKHLAFSDGTTKPVLIRSKNGCPGLQQKKSAEAKGIRNRIEDVAQSYSEFKAVPNSSTHSVLKSTYNVNN